MRRAVILITGFALLALVNLSIYKREALLARGRIVLLELAPVDPRSLMQGDYMALRFRVGSELETRRRENLSDGNLILAVGAKGIAAYRRIDDGKGLPLGLRLAAALGPGNADEGAASGLADFACGWAGEGDARPGLRLDRAVHRCGAARSRGRRPAARSNLCSGPFSR